MRIATLVGGLSLRRADVPLAATAGRPAAVRAAHRLIDPRVSALRADEPMLAHTLSVYLDSFGDVAAAAEALHVHPNTVRYRVRRIEQVLGSSLADPDVRLLLALSLRATA